VLEDEVAKGGGPGQVANLIGRLLAILLSGILLAIGSFFCVWGGYVALKVFDDYKDSSDSTYLIFGMPLLAFGFDDRRGRSVRRAQW
jgi:hypothetical protein